MELRNGFEKFSYFFIALLVSVVVYYGFSHTIGGGLLHPESPVPMVLVGHAAVFISWVCFLLVQSLLVRTRNVVMHRRLGGMAVAFGVLIPVLGIWTAVMSRGAVASLAISFNDMLAFSIAFWLGVAWRGRPEYHRRLMIIAACCLTVAAFARFPLRLWWAYAGVDGLILIGAIRDLVLTRRIHIVYKVALPCLLAGQLAAMYLRYAQPTFWLSFLHFIIP